MVLAPEWTAQVEESLAAVVAAVRAAGRNADAQPFWQFVQGGGSLPAGRLPPGALAGPPVYEVHPEVCADRVRRAPDFAGAPQLQSVSVIGHHVAAVSVHGEVLCSERPREGLFPVPLPWPAATISCGQDGWDEHDDDDCFAIALRRGGGAVCKLPLGPTFYGDGVTAVPEEVRGLPAADPVLALEAGAAISVALTASAAAYCWGHDELLSSFGARGGAAVRIPQLCGRGVCRLGCGIGFIAAETEGGDVLLLRLSTGSPTLLSLPTATVAFPLREWNMGTNIFFVDACGTPWEAEWEADEVTLGALQPLEIGTADSVPPRTVRSATAAIETAEETHYDDVALTESGALWILVQSAADGDPASWVNVSAAQPELPLGLLPIDSCWSNRVVLLPDVSCGRHRTQLFARIAVRLKLPSDPLRTVLLRFAVQSCYLGGPEDDPFWPRGAPTARAPVGASPTPASSPASDAAAAPPAAAGVAATADAPHSH